MNNIRVKHFLDDLLGSYQQTPALLEQKEELTTHITERIADYMAKGYNYDDAFDVTIRDLGDVKALVNGIAPEKAASPIGGQQYQHANAFHHEGNQFNTHEHEIKKRKSVKKLLRRLATPLSSMSVFIYLILGFAFGWWAWAWVIIPMAGVLFTEDWRVIISGMSPFIYFLMGYFFGWWAWGWLIIPISGIMFTLDT